MADSYSGLGIKTAIKNYHDVAWDFRLGVKTLGFAASGIDDGRYYGAASYRALTQVFDQLKLTADDVLVDIGCGYGRPLFFAKHRYNVSAGVGIDANPDFLAVAHKNLTAYRGDTEGLEFVEIYAQEFDYRDATVFYLYNPFGAKTMDDVLAKIYESLQVNPRSIRIAYLNPIEKASFEQVEWLHEIGRFTPDCVPHLDIGSRAEFPQDWPAVAFYANH